MEKQIIPISRDILEPIIKTNVEYVENLEEFEKNRTRAEPGCLKV